ncbi:uncharacterized protein LOC143215434 [Lasioglossum baleicum]|uniref:uncharacterized protein LOC143215434 n=1 Tax=Lasioglossum baleicum TaxID=434251 RepID=UPI003FCD3F84
MSNVSGIMEAEVVVGEQTLANRVSNTLKDESYSRPPMLFRHASMQKLRHCCQNLNLFPYLLYSFGNSKSHPLALKVHLCFGQLLEVVTARLLCLYQQLRHSLLRGIKSTEDIQVPEAQSESRSRSESCRPTMKFLCLPQEKPKEIPLSLTLAVYLAPLFLLFQLVGLLGLMEAGKCTPGFIFLISALLFLGCISLKVFFHETMPRPARRQKKKVL